MTLQTQCAGSQPSRGSLRHRHLRPEIMDQPDLDASEHVAALNGLRRINALSFSSRTYWPTIRNIAKLVSGRPVRVLDLACGGGDLALSLAKRALREEIEIEVAGWDISSLAVSLATDRAQQAGCHNIHFEQANAVQDELPTNFDIVTCSLFLHHLTESEAVLLLRKMADATCGVVLVNDLRRSRFGYYLAWIGCRLLTTSPIVHYDGPVSVEGAHTITEVTRLATAAGLHGVKISPCWPARFLLTWSRS